MGFELSGFWNAAAASFVAIWPELLRASWETAYMVICSTTCSLILGFVLATLMVIAGPHGLHPKPRLYRLLDLLTNIGRSLPFIILLILLIPVTRVVMGTSIGTTAAILPLTIAAAPFAARLIETNFLEVDPGVIEAARSFGASLWQIIFKVMLPEALPALVLNVAVLAITLVGYSAMAGAVGGGGLGDLAYRLGYQRFQMDVTWYCVILLLVMVQAIQSAGNWFYRKLTFSGRGGLGLQHPLCLLVQGIRSANDWVFRKTR